MGKHSKPWTAAERAKKSKAMLAFWRKKRLAEVEPEYTPRALQSVRKRTVPPMAETTAELRTSEFWKVEKQPPARSMVRQLDATLVGVERAVAELRKALAAL